MFSYIMEICDEMSDNVFNIPENPELMESPIAFVMRDAPDGGDACFLDISFSDFNDPSTVFLNSFTVLLISFVPSDNVDAQFSMAWFMETRLLFISLPFEFMHASIDCIGANKSDIVAGFPAIKMIYPYIYKNTQKEKMFFIIFVLGQLSRIKICL